MLNNLLFGGGYPFLREHVYLAAALVVVLV